ncbi:MULTISPECIES: cytidine deaminase [unclassified Pseudoalteromonas]|uniref:cytidine deaminase n=1 Tax=unclassified Pseudoalteromonas TaxID=194690 RepID=UPI000C08348D|nr:MULTISPECIES: cytidine deaminase [unclassified Pseudoalteromonas]MDP2635113.1 cytidine deaminase [Pseudoalteromonas sp. 1_MG-2023]PHN91473.1 cytidine deaminase [Pseudoalteromonas sp. 3D05]
MIPSTSSSPINSITGQTHLFDEPKRDALFNQVKLQRGRLTTDDINNLCSEYSLTQEQLLKACLPIASLFAVAPVSHFFVGAVVLGLDENKQVNFYFGANVEFTNQPLSLVVHAEQSAINNAWLNGAKSIVKIAISDAPCGYCRQFMNELADASTFDILLPNQDYKLNELLPAAFGPTDLGNEYSLFNPAPITQSVVGQDGVCGSLIDAALNAYVPYTKNFSAVKITTFEQGSFYGRYAENAAYSPSLAPLQSAISQLYLAGLHMDAQTIQKIELLQTKGVENQQQVSEAVLASYANLPAMNAYSIELVD